jgi:hypothetical protein
MSQISITAPFVATAVQIAAANNLDSDTSWLKRPGSPGLDSSIAKKQCRNGMEDENPVEMNADTAIVSTTFALFLLH